MSDKETPQDRWENFPQGFAREEDIGNDLTAIDILNKKGDRIETTVSAYILNELIEASQAGKLEARHVVRYETSGYLSPEAEQALGNRPHEMTQLLVELFPDVVVTTNRGPASVKKAIKMKYSFDLNALVRRLLSDYYDLKQAVRVVIKNAG